MRDARGSFRVAELCEQHADAAVGSEGPAGAWRPLMVAVQCAGLYIASGRESVKAMCTPEGEAMADVDALFDFMEAQGCTLCYLGPVDAARAISEAVEELRRSRAGLRPVVEWSARR